MEQTLKDKTATMENKSAPARAWRGRGKRDCGQMSLRRLGELFCILLVVVAAAICPCVRIHTTIYGQCSIPVGSILMHSNKARIKIIFKIFIFVLIILERQKERERSREHRTQSESPLWVGESPLLAPSLLPAEVHIIRELQWKRSGQTQTRHCSAGCCVSCPQPKLSILITYVLSIYRLSFMSLFPRKQYLTTICKNFTFC